jgi:hypothetical protein
MKLLKVLQGLFLILLTLALSVAALLTASAFKWANDIQTDPALDLSQLDNYDFTATSQVFARDKLVKSCHLLMTAPRRTESL